MMEGWYWKTAAINAAQQWAKFSLYYTWNECNLTAQMTIRQIIRSKWTWLLFIYQPQNQSGSPIGQEPSNNKAWRMYESQCMTKSTIRLVQLIKTAISLSIHAVWSVFPDCMFLLQPPWLSKKAKREPLPHWVNVQTDLSLLVTHVFLYVLSCAVSCTIL